MIDRADGGSDHYEDTSDTECHPKSPSPPPSEQKITTFVLGQRFSFRQRTSTQAELDKLFPPTYSPELNNLNDRIESFDHIFDPLSS